MAWAGSYPAAPSRLSELPEAKVGKIAHTRKRSGEKVIKKGSCRLMTYNRHIDVPGICCVFCITAYAVIRGLYQSPAVAVVAPGRQVHCVRVGFDGNYYFFNPFRCRVIKERGRYHIAIN